MIREVNAQSLPPVFDASLLPPYLRPAPRPVVRFFSSMQRREQEAPVQAWRDYLAEYENTEI